ncbi:MAG: wax ester/triacylglycerol synthase domain-containing protein [Sporichthyaceae bacterium]
MLLELLDTAPPWAEVFAAHEDLVHAVPRLRDRVVEPAVPIGGPEWVPDFHFDLGYHVQRIGLAEPADEGALLAYAAQFAERPLDTLRPPWEALLVEGLPGGRAAYLLKIHHAMTDGLGLVSLTEFLHGVGHPTRDGSPPTRPQTSVELMRRQISEELRGAPARWAAAARRAGSVAAGVCRSPATSGTKALRYAGSLRRTMSPPSAARSELLAPGGTHFRFLVHDVALADLKAAGRAAGGSVNDAFLAGILGAFRLYHERLGRELETMPVSFPISLRRPDDPPGGNRFAGARFAAPVGETDPAARIRAVGAFVREAREEPAIAFLELLAPPMSRLPRSVLGAIAGQMTTSVDVQASNIPGPSEPRYLAGARVLGLYPMGPRPGVAAMVTTISYAGTCCIGVNADPDSIVDLALFKRCLVDGFDEVLALAGPPPSGQRTRQRV